MDELLDRAPCGYLTFTDAGLIIDVNSTLLEILEYDCDQLKNQKFESVLTISGRIFFQTHFFPLLRLHGKADEIFFSLRSQSKKVIPVLVNAVRQQQGENMVNVCAFMVVDQRRKYEDEILHAKSAAEDALRSNAELVKAKQELERHTTELDRKISQLEQKNREHLRVSQILFHDLWEPLRKIFTFTDLLMQEEWFTSPLPKEPLLSRIHTAATRIGVLLRSLQEYLAVDRMDDALAEVDLNETIVKAKRAAAIENCTCEIMSDTLPTIEGYPQQLELMFLQLIENSIKFCRTGSTPMITISSCVIQQNQYRMSKDRYRYVDFVKIVFKDNSCGFDDEYREAVFGLLTKLESDSPGSGVGLAICQKVVENHFGSISAQSQIGEGVTITILLPLQQRSTATTSEQLAA